VGGQFVQGEGWQVLNFGDRIIYDLGALADSGTLSFWIQGLEVGYSLNADNHHLVEFKNAVAVDAQVPDRGASQSATPRHT
jgi:hypothetical protein